MAEDAMARNESANGVSRMLAAMHAAADRQGKPTRGHVSMHVKAGPHMLIWGMSTASAPRTSRRKTTCDCSFFSSSFAMTCEDIWQGQRRLTWFLPRRSPIALLCCGEAHAACRM